jgi:hypothetical protein
VPTGEMPRHILLSVERSLVDRVSPGTRVKVVAVASIFSQASSVRYQAPPPPILPQPPHTCCRLLLKKTVPMLTGAIPPSLACCATCHPLAAFLSFPSVFVPFLPPPHPQSSCVRLDNNRASENGHQWWSGRAHTVSAGGGAAA